MKSYTYLGVTENTYAGFVDFDVVDGDPEPLRHARDLLAEHLSCEQVEIWRDDKQVAVVSRPAQGV